MDEKMRMIPSCDDLARAVSDGSYDEGPLFDRIRLKLHMISCWVCRRYTSQIRWIDRASRVLWGGAAEPLDPDFKKRLVGRLRS
jgi:hypothetical protein